MKPIISNALYQIKDPEQTSFSFTMYPKECSRPEILVMNEQGFEESSPVETVINLKFTDEVPLWGPKFKKITYNDNKLKYEFTNRDGRKINAFRLNHCQVEKGSHVCIEKVRSQVVTRDQLLRTQRNSRENYRAFLESRIT